MLQGSEMLGALLRELDSAPVPRLPDVLFDVLSTHVGAKRVWLYLADYGDTELVPVPSRTSNPPPNPIPVGEGVAGAVYLDAEPRVEERPDGAILWVAIRRRAEKLGVLAIGADTIDERLRSIATPVSLICGASILEAARYSDRLEIVRGARQMQLAAAMQWSLLPLPAYSDPRVEIAGRLEPAYDIGGDAYDFAVGDREIELAIFDAMGHGLQSTLLSQLAVGAYRFARRRRSDLRDIASEVDQAVATFGAGERFVTAHLCRISVPDGVLRWLNVGHPAPMLARGGDVRPIGEAEPTLPLGLGGTPTNPLDVKLEPGDVIVLYSDGIVEARSPGGEPFGLDRFTAFKREMLEGPVELSLLVRRVLDSVRLHVAGHMRDDATLVAVRWHGDQD